MAVVLFRCDASGVIGTGHVMRCLVLADYLKALGKTSLFLCRDFPGHCADLIRDSGFAVELLPVLDQGTSWLGADTMDDALSAIATVRHSKAAWLVSDHYAIDAEWERRVKQATGVKILAIDGQANRSHDCDLLIDPTFSAQGEKRWQGLVPETCRIFSGLPYALLRPEFRRARQAASLQHQQRGTLKRLFIGFGGADAVNATACAVEAIIAIAQPDLQVDVVVGAHYSELAALQALIGTTSGIALHQNPEHLADLMAQADMAICAGGTMLVELCLLGVPSLVLSVAQNQQVMARALARHGAVLAVEDFDPSEHQAMVGLIKAHVLDLEEHPHRLGETRQMLETLVPDQANALQDVLDLMI